MQEAERCSNYLRQPAFQGGKSSSVHIIFAKAIFLCVSRQPGCDVVPCFDFGPETRHKSEGLCHNGRNVTTVSDIGYVIYGNLNNSAESTKTGRQGTGVEWTSARNARFRQEALFGWGSDHVR